MATAYWPIFAVLGSLNAGNKGIHCYDWSDVFASSGKRGENRAVAGMDGTEIRPRRRNELRAGLSFRLSGEWTVDNDPVPGDRMDWIAKYYEHLVALREITESTDPIQFQFITPWKLYSATCQIEDGGSPRHLNPWTAELVIDATFPDGSLMT